MTQTVVTILIIISTIAIVIAAGVVTFVVSRMMKKNQEYKVKIELSNLGNVATRFELKAQEPTGLLQFQFASNGALLGQRQAAPRAVAPQAQARPDVQQPATNAGQSIRKATGAMNPILEMAMSVGYMLPRSLGMPIINVVSRMRTGQFELQHMGNLPGQVQRYVPSGQSNSGYVGGSNAMAASSVLGGIAYADSWAPTPVVAPGSLLTLDLQIMPSDPNRTQNCTFTVYSRAVEDMGAQPNMAEGALQLKGISTIQRVVPWLVFAGISVAGIVCSVFLIINNRG